MKLIDLSKHNFSNDRTKIRKEIIDLFLNELPGTGKGHLASRHRYLMKFLPDGREIYLSRPARFNNGFDFTLNVTKTNFNALNGKRASTRPTHGNIIEDLISKKIENPVLYAQFKIQIDLVYSCKTPTNLNFNFLSGHPSELILECLKWLFVEQDVTYWHYSGRALYYSHIVAI